MTAFVDIVVPRVVADLVQPTRSRYQLRYPDDGRVSPVQAAVWLCNSADWPIGDSADPRGPVACAYRLLFQRWLHADDHARRGGRL